MTLPASITWQRVDLAGTEQTIFDTRNGMSARGVMVAAGPLLPHICRYRLVTDEHWATALLEVETEGAGWWRQVRLEHAAGRWRVTAVEQGHLDRAIGATGRSAAAPIPGCETPEQLTDALDVDLGYSPLFNTLPIRRLGLGSATPGTAHRILVAWVDVPTLVVTAAEQTYTAVDGGNAHFASGTFQTDLQLDADGFVTKYPGLANRVLP